MGASVEEKLHDAREAASKGREIQLEIEANKEPFPIRAILAAKKVAQEAAEAVEEAGVLISVQGRRIQKRRCWVVACCWEKLGTRPQDLISNREPIFGHWLGSAGSEFFSIGFAKLERHGRGLSKNGRFDARAWLSSRHLSSLDPERKTVSRKIPLTGKDVHLAGPNPLKPQND